MPATLLTRRGLLGFPVLGALMTVPDFPDEKAPDAHATAISLTGAPPLVLKRVLDFLVGQNLNGNSSLTRPASGAFNVNQPGYEISIVVATAGATAPIVGVELQWFDSGTNQLVDDEVYYFYSGNLNGHTVHGRGPSKGDQLVVIFTNYSGSTAVAINYTLMQTSRTFTREFWKTITKAGAQPVYPGFTAANSDMAANILSGDNVSLAAVNSKNLILPLYTGTVRLFGVTSDTTPANSSWLIQPSASHIIPTVKIVQAVAGVQPFAPFGTSSLWLPDVQLPRAQCQLVLNNGNTTTTETLTASVVAQEDRS